MRKKQINRSSQDREDCEEQTRAIIGNPADEKSRHFVLLPGSKTLFVLPGYNLDKNRVAIAYMLKNAAKNANLPFKLDTKYPVIRKEREK